MKDFDLKLGSNIVYNQSLNTMIEFIEALVYTFLSVSFFLRRFRKKVFLLGKHGTILFKK